MQSDSLERITNALDTIRQALSGLFDEKVQGASGDDGDGGFTDHPYKGWNDVDESDSKQDKEDDEDKKNKEKNKDKNKPQNSSDEDKDNGDDTSDGNDGGDSGSDGGSKGKKSKGDGSDDSSDGGDDTKDGSEDGDGKNSGSSKPQGSFGGKPWQKLSAAANDLASRADGMSKGDSSEMQAGANDVSVMQSAVQELVENGTGNSSLCGRLQACLDKVNATNGTGACKQAVNSAVSLANVVAASAKALEQRQAEEEAKEGKGTAGAVADEDGTEEAQQPKEDKSGVEEVVKGAKADGEDGDGDDGDGSAKGKNLSDDGDEGGESGQGDSDGGDNGDDKGDGGDTGSDGGDGTAKSDGKGSAGGKGSLVGGKLSNESGGMLDDLLKGKKTNAGKQVGRGSTASVSDLEDAITTTMGRQTVTFNGKKYEFNAHLDMIETTRDQNASIMQSRNRASVLHSTLEAEKRKHPIRTQSLKDASDRDIDFGMSTVLDWKAMLKNYLKYKKMYHSSWAKPNRRRLAVGISTPGRLETKKDPTVSDIKILIDVSGSVSNSDIAWILGEIANLFQVFKKVSGELIYWSDSVDSVGDFCTLNDMRKIPVKSTGGTNIEGALRYISGETVGSFKCETKKKDIGFVLIVTDGCFTFLHPDCIAGLEGKIHWLITGGGARSFASNATFGSVYDFNYNQ